MPYLTLVSALPVDIRSFGLNFRLKGSELTQNIGLNLGPPGLKSKLCTLQLLKPTTMFQK